MISLYFNCFLTENKTAQLSYGDRGFFYPVSYPRPLNIESASQVDILIKVIKSYSAIKFDVVVFNLDIPFASERMRISIKNLISKYLTYNKIYISFERPSTVSDWIKDIAKYQNIFKPENPLLVVMNHDHPFVDYTASSINKIIKKVFPSSNNNFGKVLAYSHAPEFISEVVNDIDFYEILPGLYRKDHINDWIDSIFFMTPETLAHIWNNLIFKGKYIGRFDWSGVSFKSLKLSMYVHAREYFRHYDSYGHITGMRLFSEFQCDCNYPVSLPIFNNRISMVNFYYQKWIDCFLIAIRDFMIKNRFSFKPKKKLFIQILEQSIKLFGISYLKFDLQQKILSQKDFVNLENEITNKIYYNSNLIFNEISTDIKLLETGMVKKAILFTLSLFKITFVLKKIQKWFS